MPSKQERRRQKRLRQEHAATTRLRKEARRAVEETFERVSEAMDALVERAGSEDEEPAALVDSLRRLLDSGAGGRMLASPEVAAEMGEQMGERAGEERGGTLVGALKAAGDDRLAWVTVGVLAGAGDRDGADHLGVELLAAEDDPERRGEAVDV
ncbi:MAG: hypothetical protein ACYCUG_15430, partial [Acidimicrobiales bacterium]